MDDSLAGSAGADVTGYALPPPNKQGTTDLLGATQDQITHYGVVTVPRAPQS